MPKVYDSRWELARIDELHFALPLHCVQTHSLKKCDGMNRERAVPSVVYCPSVHSWLGWARKLEAWNSTWISHEVGGHPATWAIIHWLPGFATTGIWNGKKTWDSNSSVECRLLYVRTAVSNSLFTRHPHAFFGVNFPFHSGLIYS